MHRHNSKHSLTPTALNAIFQPAVQEAAKKSNSDPRKRIEVKPPETLARFEAGFSWSDEMEVGQKSIGLRDYFAANEILSDMCCEVWEMNEQYVQSIMGRKIPENLHSLEAAKYEAEFFARMRYIRADAMLAVRDLQPDTSTSQQIALGIGGGE